MKAMIFLASRAEEEKPSTLEEIAGNIGSPVAFTSKILQQLGRKKLLVSRKGPAGGFLVEKTKCAEINLSRIVLAIDGDSVLNGCGLGLKSCHAGKPCALHNRYSAIRKEIKSMLETAVLSEVAGKLNAGEFVLTRKIFNNEYKYNGS